MRDEKGMIVGLAILTIGLGMFLCAIVLADACFPTTLYCSYRMPAFFLSIASIVLIILGITTMVSVSVRGIE